MPSHTLILPHLLTAVGGAVIGALSWFIASLVSGKFEPYDSSVGLLVNQFILSASVAFLAWRYRAAVPLLFMAGAYSGLNGYAYVFGSSETRAWAVLGAAVSVLLILMPMSFALGAVTLRRLLRGPSGSGSP